MPQDWYDKYKSGQQPTQPTAPSGTDWYEQYKLNKRVTSTPPPTTSTARNRNNWLAIADREFSKWVNQAGNTLWDIGAGLFDTPAQQSARASQEFNKDPRQIAAEIAQHEAEFGKQIRSPWAVGKAVAETVDPSGAIPGYMGLGEQFVGNVREGNVGGAAATAGVAALPLLFGAGRTPKPTHPLPEVGPWKPSPYDVPRGPVSQVPPPTNVPRGPSPYDVPRGPSPYDVPRPPSPYDVEIKSPYNVPRGPSPYDVPLPPKQLPAIGETGRTWEQGPNNILPRGPRTVPPKLLPAANVPPPEPFYASEIGGQPVLDPRNPANIDIFGQGIDVSTRAQNTVRYPNAQMGFNPALQRPGTTMPLGQPVMPIPPLPEPVVPTPLVPPAKAAKAGKPKTVKVEKLPKVKLSELSDEELTGRIAAGDQSPALTKEMQRRMKARAKAVPVAAPVPEVPQPAAPTVPTVPAVSPVVPKPPVVPAVPEPPVVPAAIPPVEPITPVAALPPVTPVAAAIPELPKVTAPKVSKVKKAKLPEVEPVVGKSDITEAGMRALDKNIKKATEKYQEALKRYTKEKTPEATNAFYAARNELKAASDAKKKYVLGKKPAGPLPKVEQVVPEQPKPTPEPVAKPRPFKDKTRAELQEIAKTADLETGNAIREEFAARRREGGTTIGMNLGDAPEILKRQFDEWRVLKELPENQAAFDRFLEEIGRATKVATLASTSKRKPGDKIPYTLKESERKGVAQFESRADKAVRKSISSDELLQYLADPYFLESQPKLRIKIENELRSRGVNPDPRNAPPFNPNAPLYEGWDWNKSTSPTAWDKTPPAPKFQPGDLVLHKSTGKTGRITVTPEELKQMSIQELDIYRDKVIKKSYNMEADARTLREIDNEFKRRNKERIANERRAGFREVDTSVVKEPIGELPDISKTNLSEMSTSELAEYARTAIRSEDVIALRKELRKRREAGGTTLSSGGLGEASAILKREFDEWRVLKNLPENQEAFDQFLADTGRLISPAARAAAGQKWEGVPKEVKIGADLPPVEPVNAPLRPLDYPDLETAPLKGESPYNVPRGKPSLSVERFAEGIRGAEKPLGQMFRESAEAARREAAERTAVEASEAARVRASHIKEFEKREALRTRTAEKELAKTARQQSRLTERAAKIKAKQDKVKAKKAERKAAEIPPAEVAEPRARIIDKFKNSRFMKANPAFKAITDKWIKHRASTTWIGKGIRDKFEHIANIPKENIIEFQEALSKGKYPEVRKFFDDLHDRLTNLGIEMGKKEDYLPQLWENNPKELRRAFGDKTMSEKASFQFRSFIEDYKAGKEKGLTPKMSPIELMDWYGRRAEKLVADRAALKELRDAGYLNKTAKAGMAEMNPEFGSFRGNFAEPKVKRILEDYLESSESQSGWGHFVAKTAGKMTGMRLSAGVPKKPLGTFHGIGIATRAGLENTKSFARAIKYGLNPEAAARRLKEVNDRIIEITQKYGFSAQSEHLGDVKYFEGENLGKGKRAVNWMNEKQRNWFEKNLFEKMIPALKYDAWEANFSRLKKKGMSEAEAGRYATEITDSFYSGKNVDLLYNDKNWNTAVRAITLAPNWLRSTLDLGYKIPKSYVDLLKNPKNPVAQKYAMAGAKLAAAYTGANLLQKSLTGKYMVENPVNDLFNFRVGETEDGQPRSIKLFGTAADFAKIPLQMAFAETKEGGGLEELRDALESRASLPLGAAFSMLKGEDYKGEPNYFRTRDDFARIIPRGERAKNTILQSLDFLAPPQLSALIQAGAGKIGTEEMLARLTELPIKYGRKPKRQNRPFGGPSLRGLEMPGPGEKRTNR